MAPNHPSSDHSLSISAAALARTLGTADHPLVIDVRREAAFQKSSDLICGALHRRPEAIEHWHAALARARQVVTVCVHGREVGQNAAAFLRERGYAARHLVDGIEGWLEAGLPSLRKTEFYDGSRATRWVTRARPKIDRIACPWIIRRFIDPRATFHYVPADDVLAAAKRLDAIPFDIPGVRFSHRGPRCSFDSMLDDFALRDPALVRVADIIRGADTSTLELTAQSAGLYAISLGLGDLIEDDNALLQAGMTLYDALYRWQRDLRAETHAWPPRDAAAGAPA
ncbi:MAG TPA: chromate resistance protein [Alphaproteobacteria bacterium]|nr:chromate resistance protein [Alphaproteobacteria bacterium]